MTPTSYHSRTGHVGFVGRLGLVCLLGLGCLVALSACSGKDAPQDAGTPHNPGLAANQTAVLIDAGPVYNSGTPVGAVNLPYISLTVCVPGSTTDCQVVDHVQVDTGSTGLRLLASALPSSWSLGAHKDAQGQPMAECAQSVAAFTWGWVESLDVKIGGETAPRLATQVIGDTLLPPPPAECANGLAPQNSIRTLGANGIIGIGVFRQDCGPACAAQAIPGTYYGCGSTGCKPTAVALDQQVDNPIVHFATDNNGSVLALSDIGEGSATSTGVLTFGIGTRADNALGKATVLALSPSDGSFSTLYKGQTFAASFVDSSARANHFPDSQITTCGLMDDPALYCPDAPLKLTVNNIGHTGQSLALAFQVDNADHLLGQPFSAVPNLAGPAGTAPDVGSEFVWGTPFLFGRPVFFALEGEAAAGSAGPYIAY